MALHLELEKDCLLVEMNEANMDPDKVFLTEHMVLLRNLGEKWREGTGEDGRSIAKAYRERMAAHPRSSTHSPTPHRS